MRYRIIHETHYESADPISVGHNEAWLTPRETASQKCARHAINITPEPSLRSTRTDYFGNETTQFVFNQGYEKLTISAVSEVIVLPPSLRDGPDPSWEEVNAGVASHRTPEELEAYEFTFESPRCRLAKEFGDYIRPMFPPGRSIVAGLREMMGQFHRDFANDPTSTTVSTPVEQVFRQRRGVCQDFSHMMISMLRSRGFAARYVSGYLRTLPPPGKPRLVGADASHAWLSVYCGSDRGWVDLDPTNDLFPSTDHVTIAWGRDYVDVAPVKGVYIGGSVPRLNVSVDVEMIDPEG